jgi:drug/metabolite transporter (DMT)-like permease
MLFGGNGVAMKFSYTGLGTFTTAGIRFTLASILLVCWSLYRNIPLRLTKKQWRLILVQSLIFCFQVGCFHVGLAHTTASHGAIIANVLPFLVLILAHFFIPGDRITLKKGVGILMGFSGVVILFFDRTGLGSGVYKGDAIILMAVTCWSISAIYIKRINKHFHAVQITLFQTIIAIPVFFICGWFLDEGMVNHITPKVVGSVLYIGVVTACFGFVAWNTMLKTYGASVLHSFVFIVPLAGVCFGVLFLDEPVTPHLLGAMVCIVSGIMVVNLRRRRKALALPPN